MACEARSGLKQLVGGQDHQTLSVGMAWEARSGLKRVYCNPSTKIFWGWDGLGSPFGFETASVRTVKRHCV